jgi:hypothetical protein
MLAFVKKSAILHLVKTTLTNYYFIGVFMSSKILPYDGTYNQKMFSEPLKIIESLLKDIASYSYPAGKELKEEAEALVWGIEANKGAIVVNENLQYATLKEFLTALENCIEKLSKFVSDQQAQDEKHSDTSPLPPSPAAKNSVSAQAPAAVVKPQSVANSGWFGWFGQGSMPAATQSAPVKAVAAPATKLTSSVALPPAPTAQPVVQSDAKIVPAAQPTAPASPGWLSRLIWGNPAAKPVDASVVAPAAASASATAPAPVVAAAPAPVAAAPAPVVAASAPVAPAPVVAPSTWALKTAAQLSAELGHTTRSAFPVRF